MLPNTALGVRRRLDEDARNAHGERVRAGWGAMSDLVDGRARQLADGGWALGVDPALWPVRVGDMVVSEDGIGWLVTSAQLIQNAYDSVVDWVRVAAQRRSAGGTEPGGAWFVARYVDIVSPDDPGVNSVPIQEGSGLWVGYGPPPEPGGDFTPEPGDEYVDLLTGTVYELGGGA